MFFLFKDICRLSADPSLPTGNGTKHFLNWGLTNFKRSFHKKQSVVWCTSVLSQTQILESDTIKDNPRIFKKNSTVHCRPVQ